MNIRYVSTIFLLCPFVFTRPISSAGQEKCRPTEPDMIGPFYKAGAAVRSSVGKGYLLKGVVRSSADCTPIRGAKIEFWLAGPDGEYDDNHRGIVYAGNTGAYRFESPYPGPYYGRPPHIHIRVTAEGFRNLVAQHYPKKGETVFPLDLVLVPAP